MIGISLSAIANSAYPAVIKNIAAHLSEVEYLDIGTFLKELSDADLEELVGYCGAITTRTDTDLMFDSIVLLGAILAQAEGVAIEGDLTHTTNTMILLSFEDLARKGVIEFNRQHATLAAGELQPIIARLK